MNYFGTDNDSEYEALAITLSSELKEANKVEETEVDPENGDFEVKVHNIRHVKKGRRLEKCYFMITEDAI